jgi:aldose sugar dehydrogenase
MASWRLPPSLRSKQSLENNLVNRRSLLLTFSACTVTPIWASGKPTATLMPITKGLDHPWGLAFLPDGSALVTERSGRLRRVTLGDKKLLDPISGTPDSVNNGEGGLLGIAIDPKFQSNRLVLWRSPKRAVVGR